MIKYNFDQPEYDPISNKSVYKVNTDIEFILNIRYNFGNPIEYVWGYNSIKRELTVFGKTNNIVIDSMTKSEIRRRKIDKILKK